MRLFRFSPLKEARPFFLLLAIILLFVAFSWTYGLISSFEARQTSLKNEEIHLQRLSGVMAGRIEQMVLSIQRDLEILDFWIKEHPEADPRFSPEFRKLTDQLRKASGDMIDYRLVSESGGLFYIPSASRQPLSQVEDREYFLVQQNPDTRGFHIAPPVKSRVTFLWGIPISYPITHSPHGLSVIFAALETSRLTQLFESFRPQPDGAISLSRKDGILLMRAPFREELQGQKIGESTTQSFLSSSELTRIITHVSPVDGLEKLVAFARASLNSPVVITCSVAIKDVLAPWQVRHNFTLAFLLVLSLLITGLGIRMGFLIQDLNQKNVKLQKATMAKSQFLANMSHELRTPMNGVLGLLQILPRKNLTREQLDILDDLSKSGENLLSKINEILDWSQIESGRTQIVPGDFNLPELLRTILSLFSPVAAKKGLALDLEISPEVPEYLRSDEKKLRHILENLISNAVKFTERGQVSLSVQISGDRLLFKVSDTGPGMDVDLKKGLFQPFYQADGTLSRKYGGTGLGLAISLQYSLLLSGSLELDSAPQEGTVATLDIPLVRGTPPETPASPSPSAPENGLYQGFRVLVVEDITLNIKIILRMLQNLGISADSAESGQKALELCSRYNYDLVLMDIQMPFMDGYETAQALRAMGGHYALCPVVALTAHALQGEKEKSLEAGMNDHLTKPVTQEALTTLLGRWLKLP